MKYLLSTGKCTDKIEYYIIDLIRLNLQILPEEIPNSNIGFDYVIINQKKDEVLRDISFKIENLIERIKSQVGGRYEIVIQSLDVIDGSNNRLKLVINVNEVSEELEVKL